MSLERVSALEEELTAANQEVSGSFFCPILSERGEAGSSWLTIIVCHLEMELRQRDVGGAVERRSSSRHVPIAFLCSAQRRAEGWKREIRSPQQPRLFVAGVCPASEPAGACRVWPQADGSLALELHPELRLHPPCTFMSPWRPRLICRRNLQTGNCSPRYRDEDQRASLTKRQR